MLETVNLKQKLPKPVYSKRMQELQEQLRQLQYAAKEAEVPITIAIEGWDTAGKGQTVKKLTERLDPRLYRVFPGTAPSELEQRYHFLWRYQLALPNDGEMAVFDHSWYGRVLVERVDKLTKKKQWRESYQQINEFERWLADDGHVLLKFFLHISKKEQKKRFREALKDPLMRWKITKEYRRHHKDYAKWVVAVEDMLAKTDTPHAPWTVIPANDLRYARVKFFETVVARIQDELAKRKAMPALVSRTAAARDATKATRAADAKHDAEIARAEEKRTTEAKPDKKEEKKAAAAVTEEKEVAHA